ncbi:MAG: SpoIIE family protein phosphatase [Deltaproteobacteria bacterium]|nr:SpoIIE family protein phosphatase [Deltaproteobacteria bacterium]
MKPVKLPSIFIPTTLRQRATLFILLPTLLILMFMGLVSFLLMRETLLRQWEETAGAKLQLASQHLDMRLLFPKKALNLFREEKGIKVDRDIGQFIIEQLREMEGVVQVNLEWNGKQLRNISSKKSGSMPHMDYSHMKHLDVTTPIYNSELKNETVSLVTEFWSEANVKLGYIEAILSFSDLMREILDTPWWKSNKAFLVDLDGNILSRNNIITFRDETAENRHFGETDSLEQATMKALRENWSGTIFGPGMPPDEISGYYHLKEAPWTMVIIAPGDKVLQPIMQFRTYYLLISGVGILLALLVIQVTTSRITRAISRLSKAADELAMGNFGTELRVTSHDEVGELTNSFNTMSKQLQERLRLQQAINIAREVQQNLLPQTSYKVMGADISGITLYCDETGGDYFDILPHPDRTNIVNIVAGDVVGHGLGAALLMATVRALVQCRISMPGDSAAMMNDVNRLLCRDTVKSGNFITLFYLVIDTKNGCLQWVRCGHEPAIIYSPANHSFSEMKGKGVPLGVDPSWKFASNNLPISEKQQIILIASDGVWDCENENGENFGKERVKILLKENSHLGSKQIIEAVTDAITLFRGTRPLTDDTTLLIAKLN